DRYRGASVWPSTISCSASKKRWANPPSIPAERFTGCEDATTIPDLADRDHRGHRRRRAVRVTRWRVRDVGPVAAAGAEAASARADRHAPASDRFARAGEEGRRDGPGHAGAHRARTIRNGSR